jgi:glutamate/tyrosine decarboxylase-like PLP-dependent enzyme
MAYEDDEAFAFWDYGPELTRRFRGLKVWMELSHVGTRALGEAIERNCECAQYLRQLVNDSTDFEMLAPVERKLISIKCEPRWPFRPQRLCPEL